MARSKQQARKPKQNNGSHQKSGPPMKTPPGGKVNPKAPNSAPKFGKQQTPVNGKKNKGDLFGSGSKKTPQSAPQVKRKKLAEEIDEELSDEDFEELLEGVRKDNNGKQKGSKKNLAAVEEDDSDEEDFDDEDGEDLEDDDDEDGEGMDDDDDDDDDDESADEEEIQAALLKAKQQQAGKNSKQATPVQQSKGTPAAAEKKSPAAVASTPASSKKAAAAVTPAGKATPSSAPVKVEAKSTPTAKTPAAPVLDSKQQDAFRTDVVNDLQKERTNADDRDRKSLFVKNLPPTTTEEEVKALSSDIVLVRLRVSYKKNTANKGFAFVEFKDEKTAEKNLPVIKKKKVGGNELVVDFCGSKAVNAPPQKPQKVRTEPDDFDPLKLFVTGFDKVNTTLATLQQLFPTAKEITMPKRKSKNNQPTGYAFVIFDDVAKCKKAHTDLQNKVIKNDRLVVVYAKRHSQVNPPKPAASSAAKRPAEAGKKAEPSTKKAKVVKVEEEEEDDDEDDDDDEVDMGDDDDDDDDDEEGDDDDEDEDDDEEDDDEDEDEDDDDD